jgi:hypothetical protein
MADIPAPLASRHTAVGVVVVSLLGALASLATLVIPVGERADLWIFVTRQAVLAAQALVLALAMFLVWRTLTRRSRADVAAALLAMGGFALLALGQLLWIVVATPWGVPGVRAALGIVMLVAVLLVVAGLLGLGIAVQRADRWHGLSRLTLPLAALVLVAVAVAAALDAALTAPVAYTVWSLVFLGLAIGLRSRRSVTNAGVPVLHGG